MSNSKEPKGKKVKEGQVFNASNKPKTGHSDTPDLEDDAIERERIQTKAAKLGKTVEEVEEEEMAELLAQEDQENKEEIEEDKK